MHLLPLLSSSKISKSRLPLNCKSHPDMQITQYTIGEKDKPYERSMQNVIAAESRTVTKPKPKPSLAFRAMQWNRPLAL